MAGLTLSFREYGDATAANAPVLLLHGLFGSSANWHGVARRLASDFRVLAVDLRNHGRSPRADGMSYQAMAEDLTRLLEAQEIGNAALIGHSMGGKVAMWLALSRPQLVDRLLVADIAPVTYPSRFSAITGALTGLNLEEIRDRRDADKRLAAQVPDPALRDYLLQNLVRQGSTWRWRIHLGALDAGMSEILSFPEAAGRQYAGPVLFIYGTESDYVAGAHLGIIRTLFPLARLRALPGAGHWVYAEQPDAFVRALRGFLTR